MESIISDVILAILPTYFLNYGDGVELVTDERSISYKNQNILTYLNKMHFLNAFDYKAYRKMIGDEYAIYKLPPYKIGNCTFTFIKTREYVFKGDPTYGLINVDRIARISNDDGLKIVFDNGFKLNCYCSFETLSKKLVIAKTICK